MWTNRQVSGVRDRVSGRRPRASWAAVVFALLSLIVDVSGWLKSDLKPLLELSRQNSETLKRIETKLEDHERRIQVLERRR